MIVVWVLLETDNQIIHQALGRNFHPPPGGIAIGEIITPLVIGFLGDLALPQRIGRCLPCVHRRNWPGSPKAAPDNAASSSCACGNDECARQWP